MSLDAAKRGKMRELRRSKGGLMEDTGICPYCEKEFAVLRYGYGLSCPKCKHRIDIFPDPDLWVETKWGNMGVSGNILASLCKVI